jgi:hypothetical protein
MDYCLGMFGGVENSNIFFFHLRLALDQYKGNVYNHKHVLSIIIIYHIFSKNYFEVISG